MKVFALVLGLAAAATARMAYRFSDGYLDVLGAEPVQNFDCVGRSYGYYADVSTDCRVFHVCLPITDEAGELAETAHFSFFCGNGTSFDQESLTCNHEDAAFPCEEAETLFELSNADFGRIPEGGFDVVLQGSSNVPVDAPPPAAAEADAPVPDRPISFGRSASASQPVAASAPVEAPVETPAEDPAPAPPAAVAVETEARAEVAESVDAEETPSDAEETPAAPAIPAAIPASVPVLAAADADAKAEAAAEPDAEADAEADVEADAKADVEAVAKADAEADAEAEEKTEAPES